MESGSPKLFLALKRGQLQAIFPITEISKGPHHMDGRVQESIQKPKRAINETTDFDAASKRMVADTICRRVRLHGQHSLVTSKEEDGVTQDPVYYLSRTLQGAELKTN